MNAEIQAVDLVADLMTALAESGDVLRALEVVLPHVIELLDCEAGSLFVANQECSKLVCRACVGPVDIRGLEIDASQGIAGRVYTSQQHDVVNDVQSDSAHHRGSDERHEFVTKRLLTVPVTHGETAYGVLQLVNKRTTDGAFRDADIALARALGHSLALGYYSALMTASLRQQDAINRDIELAKSVQQALSESVRTRVPMAAQVKPYRELSGDFVDHIEVDHCLYFIQADVSGKGVAASLVTAQAIALFKLFARDCVEVTQLAKQMNRELKLSGIGSRFLTAFIAKLNYESFTLEYLNCGHGDAIIHGIGDTDNSWISASKAPPLAVLSDAQFHFEADSIDFRNKRLWVVTDGIAEAKSPKGLELGLAGLNVMANKLSHLNPDEALEQVFAFFDKGKLVTHDDATLLIVDGVNNAEE